MSHVSPKAWINVMQCKMETGRARSPWHLWEAWKLFSSSLWRYRMWSCWGPATAWTAGACLRRSHGVRKLLEGALSEDLSSFFFARASADWDFGDPFRLAEGVFMVQLKRDQPPWKQPWWNASRYLDPAEVDFRAPWALSAGSHSIWVVEFSEQLDPGFYGLASRSFPMERAPHHRCHQR